jgi:hypothetical protein
VLTTKQNIPVANGAIIVPDLSLFHSLVESREVALQNGENEVRITGQGAGKNVLRIIYRHLNGNPAAPLPMTSANFGLQAWRYATAETPDQFVDGSHMRIAMERAYCSDLGGLAGYGVHEFAKAGFRDLVDMGTTSELRLVSNILSVGDAVFAEARLRGGEPLQRRSGGLSHGLGAGDGTGEVRHRRRRPRGQHDHGAVVGGRPVRAGDHGRAPPVPGQPADRLRPGGRVHLRPDGVLDLRSGRQDVGQLQRRGGVR